MCEMENCGKKIFEARFRARGTWKVEGGTWRLPARGSRIGDGGIVGTRRALSARGRGIEHSNTRPARRRRPVPRPTFHAHAGAQIHFFCLNVMCY